MRRMGLNYQMERYVCIASNHVILETERLFLREMNMDDFDAPIKTAEAIGMHFDKEYPDQANEIIHVSVIYRED